MVNVFVGFGVMYGVGIVSGLFGIGSGVFKVMVFDVFMKMLLKVSSVMSNLMMGVIVVVSVIVYFF